jgi:phosphatidylserine/phosphatidylglycerophosphate/cardiolipin synthase-like enzyme
MNNNEKDMLNGIITFLSNNYSQSIKSNNKRMVSYLSQCELHIDYPNALPFLENRTPIMLTFKFSDDNFYYDAISDKNNLVSCCSKFLDVEGKFTLPLDEDNEEMVKIIKVEEIEALPMAPKMTFEDCESMVLKHIDNAQHSIFGAVAWITNTKIIEALKRKAKEGVVIFLIADDNPTNRKSCTKLPFPIFLAKNTRKYCGLTGTMHNKFCVIDNMELLSGSFNWTGKAAEANDEEVSVDKNKENVQQALQEFKKLRNEYNAFYIYTLGKNEGQITQGSCKIPQN